MNYPVSTRIVATAFKFVEDRNLEELNDAMLKYLGPTPEVKFRHIADNLLNGVWSGMSLCCVYAFTFDEWYGFKSDEYALNLGYIVPRYVQYVPCKACLERKIFLPTINCGVIRYVDGKWEFGEWKGHDWVLLDPVGYDKTTK